MNRILPKVSYKLISWHPGPKSLMKHATFVKKRKLLHGGTLPLTAESILFLLKSWFPTLTQRVMGLAYGKFGYTVAGFGFYTNVLKNGDEVLKIYEFSAKSSEEDKQYLVDSLRKRLKLAEQYFGDYLLPTRVGIESHPITKLSCVVIRQPYVGGNLLVKRVNALSLNPKQRSSLISLLNKALKLYKDEDYLLDITKGNLAIDGDEIFILDTILMGRVDIVMFPIALKLLHEELYSLGQAN